MAEILTYSSDKLTRLLARLKRKAGDSLTSKLLLRFTKDGFHAYRNDYKKSSIQGTHVTFPVGCTHALTVAHVPQVLEFTEKESDNLTETFKQYDADEQADFISEEEEWATEFAIREKEGSPVPKEFPRKTYEQYSFTYASLFSGIGGFEQALNQFGGKCVFASEIDKFASKAYETLYGGVMLHGDITKIDEKEIPNHDILTAGTPCQSFSVAGKRKGFDDTRGTLFFDVARVAKEKQPKVVWIENVKGLVNHDKGRTLDVMIETLNEIGYTVDFDVLNSKYFGVPQNRERIFIVAIRDDLIEQEEWSEETTKGQTVVPKGKRRLMKYGWLKSFNFDWPPQGEVTTRLRDILESNVDEKYYLDEEKTAKLVAQLNEGSGIGKDGELGTLDNGVNISPTIDASYAKGLGPSDVAKNRNRRPMYTEPQMPGHVDIRGNDSIKRTYSTEGIPPTLTTMGGGHREPKIAEEQEVRPRYRIRKLTPLECWRLQGFPDETHEAVKQAGISDSQRYKQAGNAVTVSVIEAIGERLIPLITKADD